MSSYLNKKRGNDTDLFQQYSASILNAIGIPVFISPFSKITCKFCSKEITNNIQFLCPECNNSIFCINCLLSPIFSNSLTWHKHNFHIIDKMNFPLFSLNWSLKEEITLLSLIERHGLDNWEDIADSLKTKTKVECEAHYYSFYYQNKNVKFPLETDIIFIKDPNIGAYVINNEILLRNNTKVQVKMNEIIKNQGTIPEISNSKGNKAIRNIKKQDNNDSSYANSIQGYWPKRFEFDIEYLNEAENDIAELEFLEEDTEEDRKLKFKMLELYNSELDERQKRKEFVIGRNLLDIKKQINFEKKLPRDEREIYNCLKPFARFLSPVEFQDFFEGIIIEKNLRQRIEQLKNLKAQGCKTYEDVVNKTKIEMKRKHSKKKSLHKDPNNINCMIAETCGIGNNIKNFLITSNTEILENANEKEKSFAKRIGISKEEYNNIKKQIALTVLEERNIRGKKYNIMQ